MKVHLCFKILHVSCSLVLPINSVNNECYYQDTTDYNNYHVYNSDTKLRSYCFI